jgi:hypothetical protein
MHASYCVGSVAWDAAKLGSLERTPSRWRERRNIVKMAGKKEHHQDGGKEGTSSRWRERRNIVKMAGKKEHRQDGGKERVMMILGTLSI